MSYMGLNIVWWQGTVEDINDPLKLGRARVRIFGLHSADKAQIPTESLPWAMPLHPISSAATSGIGFSANGFVQGTWVFGFFRDDSDCQEPIILGSVPGVPEKVADPNIGFNDPDGVYPLEDHLNEPDTHRLARGENLANTILQTKNDELEKFIPSGLGGEWSEPVSSYAAQYPKNKVVATESGHIIELDDTPNAERIQVYHKSGSFFEIHPDGSNVTKIKGNNYTIVLSDERIVIKGDSNINVDGDTKFRGKNLDVEISNDARILVAGNLTTQVNGDYINKVSGNASIIAEGNLLLVGSRIDLNPDGVGGSDVNPGYVITTPSNPDESTDQLGYNEADVDEANVVIPDFGDPDVRVDYGDMSNLGDTAITSSALASGQSLIWNGESWQNRQLKISEAEDDLGIVLLSEIQDMGGLTG